MMKAKVLRRAALLALTAEQDSRATANNKLKLAKYS